MRIKHRLLDLATIVRPETIMRWHRRMKQQKWTYDIPQRCSSAALFNPHLHVNSKRQAYIDAIRKLDDVVS